METHLALEEVDVMDEAATEAIIKDLSRITELSEKTESPSAATESTSGEDLGVVTEATRTEEYPTRLRKPSIWVTDYGR